MKRTLDWINNRLDTTEETSTTEDNIIENIQNETHKENWSKENKALLISRTISCHPISLYGPRK